MQTEERLREYKDFGSKFIPINWDGQISNVEYTVASINLNTVFIAFWCLNDSLFFLLSTNPSKHQVLNLNLKRYLKLVQVYYNLEVSCSSVVQCSASPWFVCTLLSVSTLMT